MTQYLSLAAAVLLAGCGSATPTPIKPTPPSMVTSSSPSAKPLASVDDRPAVANTDPAGYLLCKAIQPFQGSTASLDLTKLMDGAGAGKASVTGPLKILSEDLAAIVALTKGDADAKTETMLHEKVDQIANECGAWGFYA